MLSRIVNALVYFLGGFLPRDPRKVVFGAWMGGRYADNPKYLMLYMAARHWPLDLVWCGREEVGAQIPADLPVRFVRYGSLVAWRDLLTCKTCFVTHGFRDVARWNLLRGATVTYLGHGLAIKRMGSREVPRRNGLWGGLRRVLRSANSFTYCVASSAVHAEKLLHEYGVQNVTEERILRTGQPRIDFLIEAVESGRADIFRSDFMERHGLPRARKLVTYLPTFRDGKDSPLLFSELKGYLRAQLEAVLEAVDGVLVEKCHFRDANGAFEAGRSTPTRIVRLVGRRASIDTQELLLATDLLITDYSGCYLDYLALDRPIIHFAYDYEYYAGSDRGLYFDLRDVAAGPIVRNLSDFIGCLEVHLQCPELEQARRASVRARMLEYEHGVGSRNLVRMLGLEPRMPTG